MIKICLGLAAMTLGGAALGEETFYWTGGSGTWSDVSNWSMNASGTTPAERYPGSDSSITNDIASFMASANGTITVDKDLTIYRIYGQSPTTAGENPLTFTGGETVHSIKMTSTNNGAGDRPRFVARRYVTFKNITINSKYLEFQSEAHIGSGTTLKASIVLWDANAHVIFEDGCTTLSGTSCSMLKNGAKITFNGGNVVGSFGSGSNSGTIYGGTITFNGGEYNLSLNLRHNMVLNMKDTTLKMTAAPTTDGTETINISNSRIIWAATVPLTDRRLLGDADTVVDVTSRNDYVAVSVLGEDNPVLEYGGTLYATNAAAPYSGFALTNAAAVCGDGAMYLNRLFIERDISSFNMETLCLGVGIYFDVSGGTIVFNNQRFGSFGDWIVSTRTSPGIIRLYGTSVFDTTDCFDGVTGHTINMSQMASSHDASVSVIGNGNLIWSPFATTCLKELSVGDGATFTPINSASCAGSVCADKVTLGANAKIGLRAGTSSVQSGSFEFGEGSTIEVDVPAGFTDYAHPAVVLGDVYGDTSSVQPHISCTGAGAANYSLRSDLGCVYLRSGDAYEVPESYQTKDFWTGASPTSNNTGDPANWYTNGVPPKGNHSTKVYFGGYDNMTITNTVDLSWQSWMFTKDSGPAVLRGDTIQSCSYSYFDAPGSSFISESPFPVVIEAPVRCRSNRISVYSGGDSYIEFTSNLYSTAHWNFFVLGHVRVSGRVVDASALYFGNSPDSSRSTTLEVMPGGSICFTNQYEASSTYHQLWNKIGRFAVHGGGKVEFRECKDAATGEDTAKFGWTGNGSYLNNLVDGEFKILCPLVGKTQMRFSGTGTLHVASTQTTNANAKLVLGGGIRFTCDRFSTMTSEGVANSISIEVEGDGATLAADRDWIYGPEPGVETTTTAEDRALFIRNGATLRFAAGAHKVLFADPITGHGKIAFDQGAQIGLAGELFENCKTEWAPFATVLEVEGEPAVAGCHVRAVQLGNGLTELQAKLQAGMKIILR